MSKYRERALEDLCDDATFSLSQPQVSAVLRGNFQIQGPVDESNHDLPTHMATANIFKGLSICSVSEAVSYRGKTGTCNVCSAPCSSCFHVKKDLMKPNDESAGETVAENIEIEQPSVLSTVAGMNSISDSFCKNAVGKTSLRTSNGSASDDVVVHSISDGQRVPEGHDDCLSGISGTNGHPTNKVTSEESMMKYNKTGKVSGASSAQVRSNFSPASDEICISPSQHPRDLKDGKISSTKSELLDGSTESRDLISPRGVAFDVSGDPLAAAASPSRKNDHMEVETQPVDEMDESDMMEQDVKVCDICGDAGREDLLAICSRCTDGAEHTYCMREMRTEVPEGEWLCEECQALERAVKRREIKIERMNEIEKNNSGHTTSEHLNNSDVDGQKTKGLTRISSKRHRDDDDAEVSSLVKKPALESKLGSPRPLNSGKVAVLTRENSVKILDKGRVQPQDIAPVNDTTESGSSASDLRVRGFRGTFAKSNSFSSLNSKPKVKLVDQAVIQGQKSAKEASSFRHKEGVVRSIGKSMSFKSTNSGRPESKVKMLSPRLSHIQDIKNTKLRNSFEHQRALRTERSSVSSMMSTSVSSTPKIDKRTPSLATMANNHETKPVQADSKPSTLSRSSSLSARRTADLTSSSGEFKRPLVHGHCTVGGSSANGVSSNENKVNQTNLKSDSISAERSALNMDVGISVGLPRLRDLTNSCERMKDCSGSRSGPPSAMPARDEGDNLKAAIEAAVLRKPGVYRKNRAVGQSDDSSMPSLGVEVTCHQDPISSSAANRKLSSVAELPEGPTIARNLIADSHKQENSDCVKQSSLVLVEGLPTAGQDGVPSSSSRRDVLSSIPPGMPLSLNSLAVPEHEYIWQGSFLISRSGKNINSWDGIQAHLSTCASPKVTEAANKFNSRISLNEVPRSSTWPIHFQEHGVREDNIALFFFAKDLDSYDKIYKVLLDNMMKNDLALKGNVDGVELLIFPSSQLPDNSQRWNMLYFLWGVFRGTKESCLRQMPESLNQFSAPRNIPPFIMSLPENRCSLRPIPENLNGSKEAVTQVLEMPASEESQRLLSFSNRDSDANFLDRLDHQLNSSLPPAIQNDNANRCQDMTRTSQERDESSSCSPHHHGTENVCSPQKQLEQLDTPVDRHELPKSVDGPPEEFISEACMPDKVDEVRSPARLAESESVLKDHHRDTRDMNMEKQHERWMFNHNEYMLPGPSSAPVVPPTLFGGATRVLPGSDAGNDIHQKTNNHHNFILDQTAAAAAAERRFFPTAESQLPWKLHNHHHHLVEQEDRLSDRLAPPDLELALGASDRKSPPPAAIIQSYDLVRMGSKAVVNDIKVNEDEGDGAGGAEVEVEDDVAAALSLSLSFPFPDKEMTSKSKTERTCQQDLNASLWKFGR
ncbi:RING/FYVE/PHD zinc finger superfamily protein [Striga hermonthica]|uniref:RING/FYVE/PHD zinc finger superfamily protein n=1 Tax=Striga hermonthica TaxID=68872 RepID=A0A9N7N6N8_STRHE|nr:RING/FYVE/PHD zinc finger superfamily protein [Striga hermonthica]